MNNQTQTASSYYITFKEGDQVTKSDLKTYVETVAKDREDIVAPGLAENLNLEHLQTKVVDNPTVTTILVGESKLEDLQSGKVKHNEMNADHEDFIPPGLIRILASTADASAIINAANRFFSNWRAVTGLIATSATVVGGAVVLRVVPAPNGGE